MSTLPSNPNHPFQRRVLDWMMETFSMEVCRDTTERNHRFLEESLELVQAMGGTRAEAHMLVDYVFGRPVGEPEQEVGGVMVTLAALCSAADFSMAECGDREVARCWLNIEKIRAKQAGKPKHSPLPVHTSETLGVDAEVAGQIWAALDDLYALVRKQDMEPAFRGRIERALSVGRWEPRVSQKAGAIATHFTFLWQRPKDKEPWGVIYADEKRAVDCSYRVSDIRPVRLERYPERTDQGDSGAVMPGDTL